MPTYFIPLFAAIIAEVIGTLALQASEQFTRLVPTALVVLFYLASFYFLSLALKSIPIGVAYAIWSGLGVSLIALFGWAFFGQKLDLAAVLGIGLIVAGVVVLQVFSSTSTHG